MYEMKCEDESQVQTHLKSLLRMQEQLKGMGTGLADADLITIVFHEPSTPDLLQLTTQVIRPHEKHIYTN